MSKLSRSLFTPLSVATSVGGGLLASAVFSRVWKHIGDNDNEPPDPKDLQQPLVAVFATAALQGLIIGIVRAGVQRASARGYQALANEPPPS